MSLKVQFLCWLWVSDLTLVKTVTTVWLELFIFFFSIYSEKEGNFLFTWLMDQPVNWWLTSALVSPTPVVYSPRAASEPLKDFRWWTSSTPNCNGSAFQLGLKPKLYTISSHTHLPHWADLIYTLSRPSLYSSHNSLFAVLWIHSAGCGTRVSARSLCQDHFPIDIAPSRLCSYINISTKPASTML